MCAKIATYLAKVNPTRLNHCHMPSYPPLFRLYLSSALVCLLLAALAWWLPEAQTGIGQLMLRQLGLGAVSLGLMALAYRVIRPAALARGWGARWCWLALTGTVGSAGLAHLLIQPEWPLWYLRSHASLQPILLEMLQAAPLAMHVTQGVWLGSLGAGLVHLGHRRA